MTSFRTLLLAYHDAEARLAVPSSGRPAAEVIAAEQAFTAAAVNLAVAVPAFLSELNIARNAIANVVINLPDADQQAAGGKALAQFDRLY